jgi:hypothetical protein
MQKALRRLIDKGLVSKIPAWWHLDYQPLWPHFNEGPGRDVRKIISLKRFRLKQLDLGKHHILASYYSRSPVGEKIRIKIFNGKEIPLVIVPVRIDGRKLDVLVTQRPLSQREGTNVRADVFLRQRLLADDLDPNEFGKMMRGEPFDRSKVLPEELDKRLPKFDSVDSLKILLQADGGIYPFRGDWFFLPHIRGIVRKVRGPKDSKVVLFHVLNRLKREDPVLLEIQKQVARKIGAFCWSVNAYDSTSLMQNFARDTHARLASRGLVQQVERHSERNFHEKLVDYDDLKTNKYASTVYPLIVGREVVPIFISEGFVKGVYVGRFHKTLRQAVSWGNYLGYARIKNEKFAQQVKRAVKKELGLDLPVEIAAPGKPRLI